MLIAGGCSSSKDGGQPSATLQHLSRRNADQNTRILSPNSMALRAGGIIKSLVVTAKFVLAEPGVDDDDDETGAAARSRSPI